MIAGEVSRLLAICGRAGVAVEYDRSMPTACATVRGGKYLIVLGEAYLNGTPSQQATLLAHEIAHVARGDVLALQNDKVLSARRWNIAADAHINHGLRQADIDALHGITYAGLRKTNPHLPPELPGTKRLYDLLAEDQQGGDGHGSGDDESGEHIARASDGSSVSASEHAKTVLRIRGAAAAEGLDPGKLGADVQISGGKRTLPAAKPWSPPARLATILAAIRAAGGRGALTRARSYARPGRVPGLKGVLRSPRLSVLLALDMSGSMRDWVPHALSAARALRRDTDCTISVWADRAALAPRIGSGEVPDVGYGTNPASLAPLAQQYDAVVVITDGEFNKPAAEALHDAAKAVVWIITSGGTANNLPHGSKVVLEKR